MSVLFALAAAVGWGSSDFAAGHASRRSSAVSVVILTHFAAVVALVVVSLVPGQGGSPTLVDLGWGLAAGLGGGFGAMLLFRGLGKGSMAVVAPITATGAASIPVIAGVVQGDPVTLFSVFGVLLALVAIVMVSLAGDDAGGESDEAAVAAPDSIIWAPPRGLAFSSQVPRPLVRSDPPPASLAPPFAPPVVGPAGIFAASTPLSHEVPARSGPERADAPMPTAPRQLSTWMPPPLRHTPLLDPPTTAPSPDVRSGAVALLERPPASPPVQWAPPPRPLTPPQPAAPVHAPPPPPVATVETFGGPLPVPAKRGDEASESAASNRFQSIVRRPGVVDALLSGIGFGLFFVFIARTAETAGHWPLVSARGISVVMFVAGALITRGAVLPEKGSRRAVVLAGCLDAAAALFFVLSTRDGLLSVGAVLASLYPAVTIVLARFISKERIVGRQLVGLGLAAVAVSLLAI